MEKIDHFKNANLNNHFDMLSWSEGCEMLNYYYQHIYNTKTLLEVFTIYIELFEETNMSKYEKDEMLSTINSIKFLNKTETLKITTNFKVSIKWANKINTLIFDMLSSVIFIDFITESRLSTETKIKYYNSMNFDKFVFVNGK